MSILRRAWMWLVALFRRDRLERDLDREMRFHLAMEIEANVRRGMSLEEARRQAMLAFGGVERHKESARDERGTRIIDGTIADFRFALRALRNNRGFALITTLTLAVGIGATAAVFSFANWVLYRPVPGIAAPHELVLVSFEDAPGQPTGISYATLAAIEHLPAFSGVTAVGYSNRYQVAAPGASPRVVAGHMVAGDYFGVLGVRPAAGRLLAAHELTPESGTRAVVVSEPLAESMFGSARGAVGQPLRINAVDFVIAGVTGRGFRGSGRIGDIDVWIPNASYGDLRHDPRYDIASRRTRPFFTTIGRLRPGSTPAVAQSQLRHVVAGLVAQYPSENKVHESHVPTVYPDIGTSILGRERSQQTMRLMLGIVGLALLIACANVASLLLFRGVRRRPELAVRRALGASASQLLRQHLAEGLTIGAAGAAGGVIIAALLRTLFEGQRVLGGVQVERVGIDGRVLGLVAVLALTTGVVFGVVPGLAALADDDLQALRDAGRRGSAPGSALRSALTVGQVAASVSLIVGALLLARTIVGLRRVELGFDATNVLTFSVDAEPQGYDRQRARSLRERLATVIRDQSGVEAVSHSWGVPFSGVSFVSDFRPSSVPGPDWTLGDAKVMWVSADYFRALRIPLLAGRDFGGAELRDAQPDSATAVVLSLTAARRLFGDRSPLGQVILERGFGGPVSHVVVGVVGDVRDNDLRSAPEPLIYQPVGATRSNSVSLVVRSPRPPRDVQALVENAVAAVDPSIPVPPAVRLTDLVARAMAEERVFLRLVGLLAAIAAVLAGVGLYALVAFGVAARTREIGIRMALGARAARVVSLVVRQGARLLVAGVVIGLGTATVFTRLLESRLFGVSRLDALTYAGAVLALVITGLVACVIPARQAARIDPVGALRAE